MSNYVKILTDSQTVLKWKKAQILAFLFFSNFLQAYILPVDLVWHAHTSPKPPFPEKKFAAGMNNCFVVSEKNEVDENDNIYSFYFKILSSCFSIQGF